MRGNRRASGVGFYRNLAGRAPAVSLRTLGVDVYDGLAVLGFGALEYGIAQWSAPAAWVLGGVVLMALAIGPSLRPDRRT